MLISLANKIKKLEQILEIEKDIPRSVLLTYKNVPTMFDPGDDEEDAKTCALKKHVLRMASNLDISTDRAREIMAKLKPTYTFIPDDCI